MNDEPKVSLPLSFDALMVLHSAGNEATVYRPEDRARSGAPDAGESQQLMSGLRALMQTDDEPYVWQLPVRLLKGAAALAPACLLVLDDDNEFSARTDETRESFHQAQAELLGLIELAGYGHLVAGEPEESLPG